MAIVKGNYTRSRQKIKATIRYIIHRPTRSGEHAARALFGQDGVMSRQQAYQMIDEASRGTFFFRLVVSPDARREDRGRDLNLKALTRETLISLEERLNRKLVFIAAEHSDPSEKNRHVHAIVLVKLKRGERIGVKDYQALRETATAAALLQRQALDLYQGYQQNRHYHQPSLKASEKPVKHKRRYPARLKTPRLTCPDCGYTQVMYKLKSGIH